MNIVLLVAAWLAIALGVINLIYLIFSVITTKRPKNIETLVGTTLYILLAGHVLGWW